MSSVVQPTCSLHLNRIIAPDAALILKLASSSSMFVKIWLGNVVQLKAGVGDSGGLAAISAIAVRLFSRCGSSDAVNDSAQS